MNKDKEIFIQLMNTYGDYLKRTAFHILHDVQLAEDMVQETFISYYSKQQFKHQSSPKTYLYRILINHIKMYLRKNKLKMADDYIFESCESIEIENLTINKMDLSYALKTLEPKYHQALVLYYFDDLSVAEISQILNCTKSSVKMRLKRGREQLRAQLGGAYE